MARAALQAGGLCEAIRNYARRGYRFQMDVTVADHGDLKAPDMHEAAERDFAEAQWRAAMDAFARADLATPLTAECLERWAIAAQCAGDLAAAAPPLERAAIAYSSRGAHESAARATLALARIHLESLDAAVAQGCLRRAERLLAGLPIGEQHGHLAWMRARLHLYLGDLNDAIRFATEARDIGRALCNENIEAMALLMWGIGLEASGDNTTGRAMQDEAAASVLAGDVSPLMGGIVYCGVISSCCNAEDWQRAEQWTERFTSWCSRSGIDTFAGACLIHLAEVLTMAGKLEPAQDAITRADPLLRMGARWALGDAYRLMGDICMARGEESRAEQSYVTAYQHGWDPHPGYALLLHQRGQSDEAVSSLKRAASATNWVAAERRSRYLAHAAQIASLSGQVDEAEGLIAALDARPAIWDAGAVAGQVERARAELLWATGQTDAAVHGFARAAELLRHRRAVMDAALARVRLAEVLSMRGERSVARMELAAATTVFEAAGATGYLAQCEALQRGLGSN